MQRDDWIRITLRLPPRLHAQITDVAARAGTSLNGQIVEALLAAFNPPDATLPPEEFIELLKTYKRRLDNQLTSVEFAVARWKKIARSKKRPQA